MTTAADAPRRTPLFKNHQELGGKLVDFHGWHLPVQYNSIIKEHEAVRSAAGLFDVSHMGQVFVEGPEAGAFLDRVNSNDIGKLKPGKAVYSHMLNAKGGVVDDVIVSRLGKERYLAVVNAATREKDVAWLRRNAREKSSTILDLSAELGMIAIQGPAAKKILGSIVPEAPELKRFGVMELELFKRPCIITRTGYTGEDGFEIIIHGMVLPRVWQTLRVHGSSMGLLPCGLGARDTLRLEAGYLLYGSDIDAEHTPFEAGYGWVVKFKKNSDFIGKAALEAQKEKGLERRLYGVRLKERGVPRPGTEVFVGGKVAGRLSSATFSPTLQAGIGMGYLDRPDLEPGTGAAVKLHGKNFPAEIVSVPFYVRPKGG